MDAIKFEDIWKTLSKVDCSGHTEKKVTGKAQLTYLSWAWAWGICMKHYPSATYTIREWDGRPYLNDPVAGVMVMTEVDIGGNKRMMWLPAMDGANNALKSEGYTYTVKGYNGPIEKQVKAVDMMDINKAIMRCLVKNLAMFGLGLNIYAGEDLPVGDETQEAAKPSDDTPKAPSAPAPVSAAPAKTAAKKTVSPLGKEAWKQFRELPLAAKLSDGQRSAAFKNLLKEKTGKIATDELTDAEWTEVINHIDIMKQI